MKTTVDIPDDLLIEAKKRAAELRRPLRALIADGLREQLRRTRGTPRKRKRLRFVTVRGGLAPGVDLSNRENMYEWLKREG